MSQQKSWHHCSYRCYIPGSGLKEHNRAAMWLLGQYGRVDYSEIMAEWDEHEKQAEADAIELGLKS